MMSNTAAVASPATDPQDVIRVRIPRPTSNNDNAQDSITHPVIRRGNGNGTTGIPGNGTTGTPGNGISNGNRSVINNSPVAADDSSLYVPKDV